jgi:hypothetical protein
MRPPHFLCIGAHKSGTTWLYENLKRHPSVWLPPIKELHFFDGLPGLPKAAQRLNEAIKEAVAGQVPDPAKLDFLRKYVLDQPKDLAWYRSLFEPAGDRIAGDLTPAYAMLRPAAVRRIRESLPDCRIIYIMRNPIDRAWSHFRFHAGTYKFDLARYDFERFKRHVDSEASERRTAYMQTIDAWEQSYPGERILYLFYDDLLADSHGLLETLCGFLDIDYEAGYFAATCDVVVRESIELVMEPDLRLYLARKYRNEIAALQRRFGGHTDRWLQECEQVLSDGG